MRIIHSLHALPWLLISLGAMACTNNDTPSPAPTVPHATDIQALVAGEALPTLDSPKRLTVATRPTDHPVWTASGKLLPRFPDDLALSRVEKPGTPVYDPSSDAWYASANGMLVRVEPDALPVVTGGVQGIDVDVRAEAGLAVSREPNNTIVLHRFGMAGRGREVLTAGAGFFNPRLSPSGHAVLVTESRSGGGRIWLMQVGAPGTEHSPREVAQGTSPSWHPNGRHVLFARVTHDGSTLKASEIRMLDTANGEERSVGALSLPAVRPMVSPDGAWIAMLDGRTREVLVARFDNPFAGQEGAR